MGNIQVTWLVKNNDGRTVNRCTTREQARKSKNLLQNAYKTKFTIERVEYIIVSRKVVS